MLSKAEAEHRGTALLKRLRGKGWTLHVWENLGWHYSVGNAALIVHPGWEAGGREPKTFYAMPLPSYTYWADAELCADPNDAVQAAVARCAEFVHEHTELLRRMQELAGPPRGA